LCAIQDCGPELRFWIAFLRPQPVTDEWREARAFSHSSPQSRQAGAQALKTRFAQSVSSDSTVNIKGAGFVQRMLARTYERIKDCANRPQTSWRL
jgi:hypothetical protein